jgi:hypothetical protein
MSATHESGKTYTYEVAPNEVGKRMWGAALFGIFAPAVMPTSPGIFKIILRKTE